MKAHELQVSPQPNRKRVGRGISAGQGKTAGRGTKGQNARSGGGVRPGFEGGQNPWAKRMPKRRGFQALHPHNYQVVNLEDLTGWPKSQPVTAETLARAGRVRQSNRPVKLLGQGKLTDALTIEVQAASRSARQQIETAGGTLKLISL